MQNKNTKNRTKLYIVLGVLALGGLSYLGASSEFFKGMVRGFENVSTMTAEEARDYAETYANNVTDYASTASETALAATAAFESFDQTALSDAQASLNSTFTISEIAYGKISNAYDRIDSIYSDFDVAEEGKRIICEIYTELPTPSGSYLSTDAETCETNLETFYQSYVNESGAYSSIVDPYINLIEADEEYENISSLTLAASCYTYSSSLYGYHSDVDDCVTDYMGQYEDYSSGAATTRSAIYYFEARDTDEITVAYLNEVADWYETAGDSLTAIESNLNLANSYQLLSCSALSLSPTSYEMTATETEANFDLTVTVEAAAPETAVAPLAKNLMAFALVELEITVTIDGIIEATPVNGRADATTYPTQEAWAGTLVFTSDAEGIFTGSDGVRSNPYEIDMNSAGTRTVNFKNGTAGETLQVYIEDEASTCTASLTITQAAATIEDTDGDGLTDTEEATAGTNASLADTDGDGTNDGTEVANGTDPLVDESTIDTDGDGLTDAEEATYGTDASLTDTDGDGYSDYTEVTYSTPTSPVDASVYPGSSSTSTTTTTTTTTTSADTDGDGLTDAEEATAGTDPNTAYTDGDGLSDYEEVITYGTDPLDDDSDNDGYEDDVEVDEGTDPEDGSDYPETDENYEVPEAVSDIILSREYTCTDSFEDTEGEWHEDIICRAKEAGWVKGYSSYTFGPNGNITRAEYVKVLTKIFGLDEDDGYDGKTSFYDVSVNDWYYPYINLAEDEDWIRVRDNGYYFNPNEPITRGDAILWAIRAAGQSTYDYDIEDIFSDVENSDYFAYAIFLAYETTVDTAEEDDVRVVEGYSDGTFEPYSKIARSEAMAIVTRVAIAWGVASEDWDE